MKKANLLLIFTIIITLCCSAQAPHTFSYQTVVRDVNWGIMPNTDVSILIRILEYRYYVFKKSNETSTKASLRKT